MEVACARAEFSGKVSKRMYSAGGRKPFDRTEDQDGRVVAASG